MANLESRDFERPVFHKALEQGPDPADSLSDQRHTFASRLLQNQESIVYVKDQLGHHSIKVTVDVYVPTPPGDLSATIHDLIGALEPVPRGVGVWE